jgi:hypothetical protein
VPCVGMRYENPGNTLMGARAGSGDGVCDAHRGLDLFVVWLSASGSGIEREGGEMDGMMMVVVG